VTGISVGAINGGGLANYEVGEEKDAADFIVDLWRGLAKTDVIKDWKFGGALRGLLLEDGIYNDQPLKDFLHEKVEAPKRHFIYGYVDEASGKYITRDDKEGMEDYINGILASSTYPGVLPVIKDLDVGHGYLMEE